MPAATLLTKDGPPALRITPAAGDTEDGTNDELTVTGHCRFGDPRKENCDMMCRPLRAVMVGRRYAIIVPENRDIRFARAASGRESVTSRIRHTFASLSLSPFLLLFLFTPTKRSKLALTRKTDTASPSVTSRRSPLGGALLVLTILPRALSSRLGARQHSIRSGSQVVRCRHMHLHYVTRGYELLIGNCAGSLSPVSLFQKDAPCTFLPEVLPEIHEKTRCQRSVSG